jgi:hypothetical protein
MSTTWVAYGDHETIFGGAMVLRKIISRQIVTVQIAEG